MLEDYIFPLNFIFGNDIFYENFIFKYYQIINNAIFRYVYIRFFVTKSINLSLIVEKIALVI